MAIKKQIYSPTIRGCAAAQRGATTKKTAPKERGMKKTVMDLCIAAGAVVAVVSCCASAPQAATALQLTVKSNPSNPAGPPAASGDGGAPATSVNDFYASTLFNDICAPTALRPTTAVQHITRTPSATMTTSTIKNAASAATAFATTGEAAYHSQLTQALQLRSEETPDGTVIRAINKEIADCWERKGGIPGDWVTKKHVVRVFDTDLPETVQYFQGQGVTLPRELIIKATDVDLNCAALEAIQIGQKGQESGWEYTMQIYYFFKSSCKKQPMLKGFVLAEAMQHGTELQKYQSPGMAGGHTADEWPCGGPSVCLKEWLSALVFLEKCGFSVEGLHIGNIMRSNRGSWALIDLDDDHLRRGGVGYGGGTNWGLRSLREILCTDIENWTTGQIDLRWAPFYNQRLQDHPPENAISLEWMSTFDYETPPSVKLEELNQRCPEVQKEKDQNTAAIKIQAVAAAASVAAAAAAGSTA